jgi:hypothetical protein
VRGARWETLVLVRLLVAVARLTAADRAANIPSPIVLVAGGLALGFVPAIPEVELAPDLRVRVRRVRMLRGLPRRARAHPIGWRAPP